MREALIQARNTKGLTQEQVAAAGNISTRQYRKIEANKAKPNVETAISIAKYLGCNVTDLFDPAAATAGDDAQDDYTAPAPRAGTDQAEAVQAAAELSEVSSSEMVRAALDFTDGRADTPSGRRVLDLMQTTAGAVMG